MLDEISSADAAAKRGMLSAVVVHKTGDLLPGPGFFDLTNRLGRGVSSRSSEDDRRIFHAAEPTRVGCQQHVPMSRASTAQSANTTPRSSFTSRSPSVGCGSSPARAKTEPTEDTGA
jgi:hypothetical protein